MTLILLLNPQVEPASGQLTATHWPLPPDTDEAALRQRLADGMTSGQAVEVTVLLPESDRLQGTLLLNGSLLASVVIVRAPDDVSVDQPPGGPVEAPDKAGG